MIKKLEIINLTSNIINNKYLHIFINIIINIMSLRSNKNTNSE